MKRYIQRLQVTDYMLILEVWVSSNTSIRPTENESRREEVLFVVHNGSTEKHYNWPISRNEDGTGYLTNPREGEITSISGTFANLFDTEAFENLSSSEKRRLDKEVTKMLRKKHNLH